jgi:hypothetical protein
MPKVGTDAASRNLSDIERLRQPVDHMSVDPVPRNKALLERIEKDLKPQSVAEYWRASDAYYAECHEQVIDWMRSIPVGGRTAILPPRQGGYKNMHDLLQHAIENGYLTKAQGIAYEFFMGDLANSHFKQQGAEITYAIYLPSLRTNMLDPAVRGVQRSLTKGLEILSDPRLSTANPNDNFKALVSSAMCGSRPAAEHMAFATHTQTSALQIGAPLNRALYRAYGGTMSAAEKARIVAECSNIVLENHLNEGNTPPAMRVKTIRAIGNSLALDIVKNVPASHLRKGELSDLVQSLQIGGRVGKLSPVQDKLLREAGLKVAAEECNGLDLLIHKFVQPSQFPVHDHPNGPCEVLLTPTERRSLLRVGVSGLFMPNPEASYANASQLASRANKLAMEKYPLID